MSTTLDLTRLSPLSLRHLLASYCAVHEAQQARCYAVWRRFGERPVWWPQPGDTLIPLETLQQWDGLTTKVTRWMWDGKQYVQGEEER